MRGPVSCGMRYAPNDPRARGAIEKETGYEKTSTVRVNGNMIFKGHKLTIAVDPADHWSCYCVLDEAGKIILEQKVAYCWPSCLVCTSERIPSPSLIVPEQVRSCFGATTAPRPAGNVAE